MIRTLHVERLTGYDGAALAMARELREVLGVVGLERVRLLRRYCVAGVDDVAWETAVWRIFAEAAVERLVELPEGGDGCYVFGVEYLPGQFDQRADSAVQCLRLLADVAPVVRCADVIVLEGKIAAEDCERIKKYVINPVDSREAELGEIKTLEAVVHEPEAVARIVGFGALDAEGLEALHAELGLAMSVADLRHCQKYFRGEGRAPTLTEVKLLDTYWSDHCRHTTFLTELTGVEIAEAMGCVRGSWERYLAERARIYGEAGRGERPVCLMDIALMGMKALRQGGQLAGLEASEENNAASVVVPLAYEDGGQEEWLLQFKNETHNHPTEIEPFGGAATCLGGAIRDPLSGRSYVYQAMRVTGSGDPRKGIEATLPGKLPQRKLTVGAAEGYSSYGNQIGLATGCVHEVYDEGFVAKRMEIGAVIAASPRAQVVRERPVVGNRIVLVGGRTGRDGIGGATGSSKAHTERALENAAEVQKGDAPTERKLQRLFRDPRVSRMIRRCNDFGAGGVSVAIGELADSLEIQLDAVPLKYAGLDGTEIALSESQERMAVVLDAAMVSAFIGLAEGENLEAVEVAEVTDTGRLRMHWRGDCIVDLARSFIDTNGVRQRAEAQVRGYEGDNPMAEPLVDARGAIEARWMATLEGLNVCSQRGLVERFDSSVGAATVLNPYGGVERVSPQAAMVALLPTGVRATRTASIMSFGYNPRVARWSPYHGAVYAVVEALSKIAAVGGRLEESYLTFQEYFERLRGEPQRWGKPLAALLGGLEAQLQLGVAAIGGKDSMSGSFEQLDVPPTLVAFAVSTTRAERVVSAEFKRAGSVLWLMEVPEGAEHLPDWGALKAMYAGVAEKIGGGQVLAAQVVGEGGVAAAVAKMGFGNGIGCALDEAAIGAGALFKLSIGALVLELRDAEGAIGLPGRRIGRTCAEREIRYGEVRLDLDILRNHWEATLEGVFPTQVETAGGDCDPVVHYFEPHRRRRSRTRVAKPRVCLPIFPGTNCEYDTERAFVEAGAVVEPVVFRNLTHGAIEESLARLAEGIGAAQILALAGGFSAGDEPAGSGKFIATVLANKRIAEAMAHLLKDRDGLVLGICNGFQALIKSGYLPHGKPGLVGAGAPTLTDNQLGRHVSVYVRTKVVSKLSPWLSDCALGAEYMIAMSHGEGRVVGSAAALAGLVQNDQVATQYVDRAGRPTLSLPENPNGSMQAIEGITSPCGRIFGKMGHSERAGRYVGMNVPGEKRMPLFSGGVRYFTD